MNKLNTITLDKKVAQRNFRPSRKNQQLIAIAERLGFNVSEIINEVLESGLESAMKKKTNALQKELQMVRDTGFEPVTPTVSR